VAPLWWTVAETAADARRGYPWVGLPSGCVHAMGNVQDDVRGVLVIENADTFQRVCMHCPEVTDRRLWGKPLRRRFAIPNEDVEDPD
jgi:hypothetical protein